MNNEVVSIRQVQRNYRDLVNRVKRTKQPLYLGARFKKEVVLIDIESYDQLKAQADRSGKTWGEVKETLSKLRLAGKKNKQKLSDFIYADRHRH